MISRVYGVFAALLLAAFSGPAQGGLTNSGWTLSKMTDNNADVEIDRGYVMHTTAVDTTGAAFRCVDGKLYAVLSVKPLDISYWLGRKGNSNAREVRFSVNDGPEKTEEWMSLIGGRFYMPTKISSTNAIFQAALEGATVRLSRSSNKQMTISLPQADQVLFDEFLDSCSLTERNHPTTAKASD